MQGPKWPLFYSHVDLVWSLLIVGTSFVPWVEFPVQRRLCLIFMSGVGLPDIYKYSALEAAFRRKPGYGFGRDFCITCIRNCAF